MIPASWKLGPWWSDFVQPSVRIEGARVVDGVLRLGTRSGPEPICRFAVMHEMCHLVEIDDARATVSDWGLSLGRYRSLAGHYWWEQRTSQCVERELRVGAWQWSLCLETGHTQNREEWVNYYCRILRFLPFEPLCVLAAEEQVDAVSETTIQDALKRNLLRKIESGDFCRDALRAEWARKLGVVAAQLSGVSQSAHRV